MAAMSANRYLAAAENVAEAIPLILAEQGLDAPISRFVLTETEQGNAWLFVVMDDSILEDLESYAAPGVVAYLSTALHGHVMRFSNSYGLRYAVLLGLPNLLRRQTDSGKQVKWSGILDFPERRRKQRGSIILKIERIAL
jgi:hypothetical protein